MSSQRAKFWNDNSSISEANHKDAGLEDIGTSMNAISLGFVATAILVSMFLIMAIFEHLLRPSTSYQQSQIDTQGVPIEIHRGRHHPSVQKINSPKLVPTSKMTGFSVLMPGQPCPTYLALPAPLPCPREGIHWPPHDYHNFISHYSSVPH